MGKADTNNKRSRSKLISVVDESEKLMALVSLSGQHREHGLSLRMVNENSVDGEKDIYNVYTLWQG